MSLAAKYSPTAFTLFSACLLCSFSFGQAIDMGKLDKDPGYIFFNGKTEYLKSNSIISLDSVLNAASQKRFEKFPDRAVIFHGYDPYYYWYRFSVINPDSVAKKAIFLFAGKGVRTAELWQKDGDKWCSLGKTGYKYPFDSRLYVFTSYCYPVTIPPHSVSMFYLNIDESHAYKVVNLAFFEPHKMEKIRTRFYYVFGIFAGVLLLFALLNIYLYFSVKESIHLWYSLYVLFSLMFIIKHEGLDMQFLGLDSELSYRAISMAGIAAITSGFLVHVVQLFLTNIPKKSFLSRALFITKWSLWLSGICFCIVFLVQPANSVESFVFEWANKTTLAAIFVILGACSYSIAKGYKPAWILLSGQLVFLIGGLFRTLFIGDLTQVIPPAPFQIGLLVEVVIISFGLMYRYNLFKKEKELLAAQLQDQQLKASGQILATQENERKRIAEDLHDELGGNLAAIKMALQSFELPNQQNAILKGLIDNASVNARDIAHNLMPPDFEKTGLRDMLKAYYQRQATEKNIRFQFYASDPIASFDKQDELMMYRILMELTNNIYKHSMATEATIQLVYYDSYLEMMIEDNGKGFSNPQSNGIGLKNIRSRVDYLGGSLNIDTGKKGTTIIIRIPYKKYYDASKDNNRR